MIQGTERILPPQQARAAFHIERAYWLTTRVETSATFGTVVAYDGTGTTAAPDQHIAVYPSELADEDYNAEDDQGGLWKLLRRMEVAGAVGPDYHNLIQELWDYFKSSMNAYVAQDGVLRYIEDGSYRFTATTTSSYKAGDVVYGRQIRDALTPGGNGQVPKSGKDWDTAAMVAALFHALMVHPAGQQIQLEFGKEHLLQRSRQAFFFQGSLHSVWSVPYQRRELTSLRVGKDDWTEEMDLAMAVYQAHSVNAPTIAMRKLMESLTAKPSLGSDFARLLIERLGNSTYGQWSDDLPSGRYQRTRNAARESGLWSRSLFEGPAAIMPSSV